MSDIIGGEFLGADGSIPPSYVHQAILEACYLVLDEMNGIPHSPHYERFLVEIAAAVAQDQLVHAAENLGYNGTSESTWHPRRTEGYVEYKPRS